MKNVKETRMQKMEADIGSKETPKKRVRATYMYLYLCFLIVYLICLYIYLYLYFKKRVIFHFS